MKSFLSALLLALGLLAIVFRPVPADAATNRILEDYLDRSLMDAANTTACWDTVAGAIRLDEFAPAVVGSCVTIGDAWRVAVAGDYAYITENAFGLRVIDVADPGNPVLAGSCPMPDLVYVVALAGDFAYLACRYSGLQVVDISDPTNPFIAGTCDTPDWAFGVAVAGDHAYVADGWSGGLQVIDISDPTAPVIVGSCSTPTCAWYVAVEGDHAFIADEQSGLVVVDVSDPTAPVVAGSLGTVDFVYHVAVAGDLAYLAANWGGILAVDISDRTNPTLVGSCDTPDRVRGVTPAGDHLYATDGETGLLRIDVADPAHPFIADRCDTPGWANDVAVAGEHAFVADVSGGLQVLSIARTVLPPLPAGSAPSTGNAAQAACIRGDRAFVTDYNTGLLVYDVADPTAPLLIGSCAVAGIARDVAVAGDYAFVANQSHRLDVFDVSDPAHPVSVAYCNCGSYPYTVTISGDHAFVGDTGGSFFAIDISDPLAPVVVDALTLGPIQNVRVEGDHAYLADSSGAFRVVDVHDPRNMVYLAGIGVAGNPLGLAVAGDHAFVGTNNAGLKVVDISDPLHPALVGPGYGPGIGWRRIDIKGNHLFIAGHESGFHVLDVSNPAAPVFLGSYNTPGYAYDVAVAGDHAFVPDYAGGLQVIEVFNRRFDIPNSLAQSVVLGDVASPVQQVRLETAQSGTMSWGLNFGEGLGWQSILPGSGWQPVTGPGADIRWRAFLNYQANDPTVNPTCTELALDWLYEFPLIEAITDIPGDQGGQVRISWARSSHDWPGSDPYITEYAVYRRIDQALAAGRDEVPGADESPDYPEGDWDFVTTVPADVEDGYATVVPTLADSSIAGGMVRSVFFVRARTAVPGTYFDAPPDSGYSVDNLAPSVPEGFLVAYGETGPLLTWRECPDEDFRYFRVYRGDAEGFEPSSATLVHQTVSMQWQDPDGSYSDRYLISAVDFAGNESPPTAPDELTDAPPLGTPAGFALLQNTPNPFNPVTRIPFEVPASGGKVRLEIFDLAGRLVVRLVDEALPPGPHAAVWNGRDGEGHRLGSGVYLYRLTAPGYSEAREMVMVR